MENWKNTIESQDFQNEMIVLIEKLQDALFFMIYDLNSTIHESGEQEKEEDWYIILTVGMNEEGKWGFQTGDNSFTGAAYSFPIWAVVPIVNDVDSMIIFKEIYDQLGDGFSQ